MSTQQSTSSVPFSISHPQQHVRLLELTPELLALITATENKSHSSANRKGGKDDGSDTDFDEIDAQIANKIYDDLGGRVQLKSAPPSDGDGSSTKPKEEFLHVCTEDKVWTVRQVSTSNSVYVLKAADVPGLPSDDEEGSGAGTRPGMTAFAQPTSTLELLPIKFEARDVEGAIRRLLPLQDLDGKANSTTTTKMSTKELFKSVPYPLHSILAAQRNVFVITPKHNCCIPTPQLLLASWKAIFAMADEYPLDTADMVGLGEYTTRLYREGDDSLPPDSDEEMDYDDGGAAKPWGSGTDQSELLACTVRAIAEKFVEDVSEVERLAYSLEGQLKGKATALFVGEMVIRCADGGSLSVKELEEEWGNLVPESWRQFCIVGDLTALGGVVDEPKGTIIWSRKEDVEATRSASSIKKAGATGGANASAAPVSSTRNWHEKFGGQRKQ